MAQSAFARRKAAATSRKQSCSEKRGPGRPSAFKPEYIEQAKKLCLLGATDKDLANFFDVTVQTVTNWKNAHPEFFASLKAGKAQADAQVERSLFRRALGYKHKAVKILTVADGNNLGSHVEEVPYIEHFAPDTTACIFWLKNRKPEEWRDKLDVDLNVGLADRLKAARERAQG